MEAGLYDNGRGLAFSQSLAMYNEVSTRAAMIHSPHDKIRITILASRIVICFPDLR